MKLAIGSANFGRKYSIKKRKISLSEIKLIKKIAIKSNISLVDTAEIYGESQKMLSDSKLNKLKIVTKIKFKKKNNLNRDDYVNKKVDTMLKKLKVKKIYSILFHDYKDALGKNGSSNIRALFQLKKKKIVKKIGISIYDPSELRKIWKKWKPDLVQAPFNIIDQRIYKTKWLKKLKKHNVEVHVRSCFLQGVLTNYNENNKVYKKFNKWKKLLNNWNEWSKTNNISRVKGCINFIRKFEDIDYLIIGIENSKQLLEIIKIFNGKISYVSDKFRCNDRRLIEPVNWI